MSHRQVSVNGYESKEEWSTVQHVKSYLNIANDIPHRREGEGILLEYVPFNAKRILDLGTGDGRLVKLLKRDRPNMQAVALDISPTMLKISRDYFAEDEGVKLVEHDLSYPLPELGVFDAVVSSFAIHHLTHKRKRSLYTEVFDMLNPSGIFCNLEHVASPTPGIRERFLTAIGAKLTKFVKEDKSNKLLAMETRLYWLREIGFIDVDCYWKWLELALLVGIKSQ